MVQNSPTVAGSVSSDVSALGKRYVTKALAMKPAAPANSVQASGRGIHPDRNISNPIGMSQSPKKIDPTPQRFALAT